ncbi:hypothetical protein [Kitasatospora sp. NPDC094011]|uniref:hypothetical protein n=1 Tax=Kitasatospora sp. NPDC094011 TaxID=3364090 RepID=UPI00382C5764
MLFGRRGGEATAAESTGGAGFGGRYWLVAAEVIGTAPGLLLLGSVWWSGRAAVGAPGRTG